MADEEDWASWRSRVSPVCSRWLLAACTPLALPRHPCCRTSARRPDAAVDVGKKKPSGGMGGIGGNVVVRATDSVSELRFSRYVLHGADGGDASGNGKNGRRGRDKIVNVPCGTVVKEVERTFLFEDELEDEADGADADLALSAGLTPQEREELGLAPPGDGAADAPSQGPIHRKRSGERYRERIRVLSDLVDDGQRLVVARGGAPGLGNRHMGREQASSEETRARSHIAGSPGQTRFLELELRALADVGLVGFPNAGKSSLLRILSKARPKVASYAFTTLQPVIGTARFDDGAALRIADIPGLISGAHANRGLGHEFLRHVQRTSVLVYVVDAAGARASAMRDAFAPERAARIARRRAEQAGLSEQLAALLEQKASLAALGAGADCLRSGAGSWIAAAASAGAVSHAERTVADAVASEVDAEMIAEGLLAPPAATSPPSEKEPTGASDPVSDLRALQAEIQAYDPSMAARPALVVANKCDLPGAAEGVAALRQATSLPVVETSARDNAGGELLAQSLRFLVRRGPT